MMYVAATSAVPASVGAHGSESCWGQTVHGASVAHYQAAYGDTTPEEAAIIPAGTDGRQNTLPLRFEQPRQWEAADTQRFHELAVKCATGAIGPEEQTEMDRLVSARRRLLTPMTIDQMRFECRRRRAVQDVLSAFDEYFRLVKSARSSEE